MKKLLLLSTLLFTFSACNQTEEIDPELLAEAQDIHERVITLDTHVDISTSNFTDDRNYSTLRNTQVDLPKMEEGGLDVAFFVVYTGQDTLSDEGYVAAYENADDKFKAIHRLAELYAPDRIELATTSDDVRRIAASGKLVAMIGVENAYPLGTDLSRIKEFAERGATYMSLSHNGHSQFSDSNTGERDSVWLHDGLSDLGREAIKEMNKWGIMIDLSHPSKKANMETMRLSKAPVIASHSSARALNKVSRNLDDEELMMLKENGGVVQTVAFRSYIDAEKHRAYLDAYNEALESVAEDNDFEMLSRREIRALDTEAQDAYYQRLDEVREMAKPDLDKAMKKAPPVDVADFVDHIDYMVELIGIDHVGISSDFDGGGGVYGWMDASQTFNVTLELVKRGYTEEEIEKLWSGNLLRVLDEVQAVAAELQES